MEERRNDKKKGEACHKIEKLEKEKRERGVVEHVTKESEQLVIR